MDINADSSHVVIISDLGSFIEYRIDLSLDLKCYWYSVISIYQNERLTLFFFSVFKPIYRFLFQIPFEKKYKRIERICNTQLRRTNNIH